MLSVDVNMQKIFGVKVFQISSPILIKNIIFTKTGDIDFIIVKLYISQGFFIIT